MGFFSNLLGTLESTFKVGRATLDPSLLTASRTFTLPDKSGTLLLSDEEAILEYNPPAAQYLSPILSATAFGTITGVANRMDIFPWVPTRDVTIDELGVEVTTAVASAQAKVVIYDSDPSNRPNALLFETSTFDCSTVGYKSVAHSRTFSKGKTYWIGIRHSSTAALRAVAVGAMPSLGLTAGTSTTPNTVLRRTLAFATAAPSTWGFVASEATNSAGILLKMRVA